MSKGLFAGMSIEGAGLNEDENANHVYWGSSVSARSALNKRATDKRITPLIREIEKLMKKAD
jgi:lipid-binding SYLF domain-containing protein